MGDYAEELKFKSRITLEGKFSSKDQSIIAFSEYLGDEKDGIGITSFSSYSNKHTVGFVKDGEIYDQYQIPLITSMAFLP